MIAALFTQTGARLTCFVKGHKRGKRMADASAMVFISGVGVAANVFQCPRCRATWTRKVKA